MKKHIPILRWLPVVAVLTATKLPGDLDHSASSTNKTPQQTHSNPGENLWNKAKEPADWWGEIERVHGHVGPWNVLGWRMGKAALRELNAAWGLHELDIVCHVPLETPYSCLADGLVVANTVKNCELAPLVIIDFLPLR